MKTIQLKPGREKFLYRRHPWIFSGAVAKTSAEIACGETVEVLDARGASLAVAAYSPNSQIRARVWSWETTETIDGEFFRSRLATAFTARQRSLDFNPTNAYRLVHAESDGLPGLIVDRYAEMLVMQCLSCGIERWRELLADLLIEMTGANGIYERSDVEVRALEGLPERNGILHGTVPEALLEIQEGDLRYYVDVRQGHKTGFYIDQRVNRLRVKELAENREVLDCFAYTGGFSIAALSGGASSVMAIDSSGDALRLAEKNLLLNNLHPEKVNWVEGDVFQMLRTLRDQDRKFDLIVLDPPKFAPTAAQTQAAARGYKDINLLALKLLREQGLLVTFSCSGGIDEDLFQKIVAGAALDAGATVQIIERLHQGWDHPVALNFPEGAYLKGFILRKLG